MNVTDMILVIHNDKGNEKNTVMNLEDYLKFIGADSMTNSLEVAQLVMELCKTKTESNYWSEHYFSANKSVSVSICKNEQMLTAFLAGAFNDDKNWQFSVDKLSKDCERKMWFIGYDKEGKMSKEIPHYEKLDTVIKTGDIYHNFNGNDYRVMEKYSDRNMLLMDVNSGNMLVGKGVFEYKRVPKGEAIDDKDVINAIEWDHGIYLPNVFSLIDFKLLKENYSEIKEEISTDKEDQEFMVEIKETLSRIEKLIAPDLDEAIRMAQEKYENEDIILDADDMKDVSFGPYENEKVR